VHCLSSHPISSGNLSYPEQHGWIRQKLVTLQNFERVICTKLMQHIKFQQGRQWWEVLERPWAKACLATAA